jgi:hypothetical protein
MAQILEIYRDFLKPGCDREFSEIEEKIARTCAELRRPHPCLELESLTGPNQTDCEAAPRRDTDAVRLARHRPVIPLNPAHSVRGPLKRLEDFEQRANNANHINDLEDLIESAEQQGQLVAYICPVVEILDEGIS